MFFFKRIIAHRNPVKSLNYFAVTLAFLLQSAAFAGIPEFNAAMQAGDYTAAAAETVEAWESYDKSRASAVTIAREFAFVNYMAEEFETANIFIANLTDSSNPLSERDDQPSASRVLASLIAYRIDDSPENRERLLFSLQERVALPDLDNISVVAAEFLYTDDWTEGRLSEVGTTSGIAIELLDRGGAQTLTNKRRVQVMAGTANFLQKRDTDSYYRLADLHDSIVNDIDSATDRYDRDILIALKWVVQAWVVASEGFLEINYSQLGSNIDTSVKPRPLKTGRTNYLDDGREDEDSRPYCQIQLDLGNLRYPASSRNRGLYGAVITKMDFDNEGRGSNPSVLASVPEEAFAENVIKSAPSFRITPAPEQNLDECRLSRINFPVVIGFRIQ